MQELEKILEREEIIAIEELEEENERCNRSCEGCCFEMEEGKCYCKDALVISAIKKLIERIELCGDGWIPVDKRLPEDDIEVLIAYSDVDNENETGIDITTYGYATLGGNKLGYKEWKNPFPYFKGNYKVIAWQPLPEPYRPEQPETCKYTGGSCCWPIDQCSDCPNHPKKEQ